MNRRKLSILIATALVLTSLFTSCGTASTSSSNITSQQQVFNEATAKTDSKKALQDFLNSHKNNEVLINYTDLNSTTLKELQNYVNQNFSKYFTSDFLNDTDNDISTGVLSGKNNTFYIARYPTTINFKNDYLIYSPTVNQNDKTVTYEIKESVMTYLIEMKQDNGVWKINKVSD